jgi:hypothetical protein
VAKNKKSQRTSQSDSYEHPSDYEKQSQHRPWQKPAVIIKSPVPFPDVVNMDVLATMLDEDLFKRLQDLEIDHNKVVDHGYDSTQWDNEISFVRREMQIRRIRRDSHDQYMNAIREQDRIFIAEESRLPIVDFDNFKQSEDFNRYE